MKTSMEYPIRFWATLLAALLLYQWSTEASASKCKYEKQIDMTLDLSLTEQLSVSAVAGDVLKDSSGTIRSRNIVGHVEVPREG